MVYYFAFLCLICFIAWGQKNDNVYDASQKLLSRFRNGDNGYYKGVNVSSDLITGRRAVVADPGGRRPAPSIQNSKRCGATSFASLRALLNKFLDPLLGETLFAVGDVKI